MAGLLDGIKVLDLSRVLAGPYCTQFLGELGAEVVKVEPPGHGDDTRLWGPPFVGPEGATESLYFLSTNRNKKSIVIDLGSEQGREIVRRLATGADVLVENFRPGTLERWELGHETLAAANPALVHIAISGFGQSGRYRDRPGYDLIAQGMGGLMAATGEQGGEPVKIGLPIADLNAANWSIIGVLMALYARQASGRGQYLDISLLEAQLALHVYATGLHFFTGSSPAPMGTAHPIITPYQAYRCRDGFINVAVGSERLWRSFCGALGLPIADDERFCSNERRVEHREELASLLTARFSEGSREEFLELLGAAGVPCGPINTTSELYEDPWVAERGQLVRLEHPTVGEYVGTSYPLHGAGAQMAPASAPPLLGEHTHEVLTALGYAEAAIEEALPPGRGRLTLALAARRSERRTPMTRASAAPTSTAASSARARPRRAWRGDRGSARAPLLSSRR